MIEAVYIHIPFCKNICSYCDFAKVYYNSNLVVKYLKALEIEIIENYQNDIIKTLYIGGGTPSSLNINELKELFRILKHFKLAKNIEFTFECNVSDLNKRFLTTLKEAGVNRLSIGVQSFNKKVLNNIGRKNIPLISKIKLAKEYFNNISIDIIYGSNNETINDLKKDLEIVSNLSIPHISIYSLIISNNTILKINNYKEKTEEEQRIMYDYIRKTLKKEGYEHYEISSFAKKGFKGKHNLTYWHNNAYYGFGLSASGYSNNIRYTNTKSLSSYLNHNFKQEIIKENLKSTMSNEMILNLRLIKGISKKRFKEKYHQEIKDVFDVKLLKENKTNYYLSKKHLYVSNYILCDFI